MNPDSNATSTVEEIDAIQKLMSDLEQRLHRLSGATKRELSSGSADVRNFVTDALSGIMGRVREGAHSVSNRQLIKQRTWAAVRSKSLLMRWSNTH